MRLQCYLNDILIQALSPVRAKEELQTTIRALQDHGFSVNFEKSHLVPTTHLLHQVGRCVPVLGMSGQVSGPCGLNPRGAQGTHNGVMHIDCSLGTTAQQNPAVIPSPIPTVHQQQLQCQGPGVPIGTTMFPMVDISSADQELCLQGAQPSHNYFGWQPLWLEHSSTGSDGPRWI